MKLFDLSPITAKGLRHDNTNISINKKIVVEHQLIGSIRVSRGLQMWECNNITGVVRLAKYRRSPYRLGGKSRSTLGDLITDKDCIYLPALNHKAAMRKFAANKSQSHYYAKDPVMEL